MTRFRIADAALIKGRGIVLFGDVISGTPSDGMRFESPFSKDEVIVVQGIEIAIGIDDAGTRFTRFGLLIKDFKETDFQRWRDFALTKPEIHLIK